MTLSLEVVIVVEVVESVDQMRAMIAHDSAGKLSNIGKADST